MKELNCLVLILIINISSLVHADNFQLKSNEQKSSYALGVDYMNGLYQDNLALDNRAFLQGIKDVQAGLGSRLNPEEQRRALNFFIVKRLKQRQLQSDATLAQGKTYLLENKKHSGVKEQPSGLQYKILKMPNSQQQVTSSDGVAIRYRLFDIKGKQLMASPEGNSQKLVINAIFPGLQEALLLMKVGEKIEAVIPPELAFGVNGSPDGLIKPNQTLVYELELVSVISAEQAKVEMEKPTLVGGKPNTFDQ